MRDSSPETFSPFTTDGLEEVGELIKEPLIPVGWPVVWGCYWDKVGYSPPNTFGRLHNGARNEKQDEKILVRS